MPSEPVLTDEECDEIWDGEDCSSIGWYRRILQDAFAKGLALGAERQRERDAEIARSYEEREDFDTPTSIASAIERSGDGS